MPETRVVNPLVDQFRKGGVPRDLRAVAAQGALPLKPSDLVELVHFLLADADAEIRSAAAATLAGLPVAEWLPILKDRETLPEVLSWGLMHREERELREVALQNHTIPDETMLALAGTLPEPLAELVVINQTRLLRSTPLLEALEANPNLNKDQQRRLRELRETFKIGVVEAPPPPPPPPPPASPAPEPEAPVVEEAPPATDDEAVVRYLS